MRLRRSGFAEKIWGAIDPIFQQVLQHPFVTEVQDGTLSRDAFRRFVIQDSFYLREYGQCLAMCGAFAENNDDLLFFCDSSRRVVEAERTMHGDFLLALGIDAESVDSTVPSPTTVAYTSWEKRACAGGRRHEAMGSVLPCFWFYAELGIHLSENGGSKDPLYQSWINNYAAEPFVSSTQSAIEICGRLGDQLGDGDQASMLEAVVMSARYEWMFWDSAYRDEQWAI